MPYTSIEELPVSVRDNLPKHGQEIFLAAYNSAWEGTCNDQDPAKREPCANKIAWSAVEKAYHKDDDGVWVKNACTGPHCFFGNAVKNTTHEAVLLTLNRWLAYGKKRFYNAVENFDGTGPEWDAAPLIYAQEHPDPDLVEDDLAAALEGVRTAEGEPGKICGALSGTDVTIPGQPRLESGIRFSDPVVEKRYNAGELSLSVAHRCREDKQNPGHLVGKVRPNHVLIFVQDDENQPRDLGAMLLNKADDPDNGGEHVTETFENTGKVISNANMSEFKQALDSLWTLFKRMTTASKGEALKNGPESPPIIEEPPDEAITQENIMEELKAKLKAAEETIAAKDLELANKTAELDALKKEADEKMESLKVFEQKQRDTEWETLKNKRIPDGWLKGEGKEAELRQEYEADKVAFMNKLMDQPKGEPTPEEGDIYAANTGGTDPVSIARELRMSTGRMR